MYKCGRQKTGHLKWHEDTGEYMYDHPYSGLNGQTENGILIN